LVREGGRLRVSFAGVDASGRNWSTLEDASSFAETRSATRAVAEAFDTLLYVRGSRLLTSSPVTSTTFQFATAAFDTSWAQSLARHGDTIHFIYAPYVDVSCNIQNLTIWMDGPDTGKYLARTTPEGFELAFLGRGSSIDPYPTAAKFRRLSGTPGSLVGRFQYFGAVYRPTLANVPDSTKRILSEDSARSEQSLAKLSPIYEFTETSFSLVGQNRPSFARQFLTNWSYSDESSYYYSPYDSTWTDERRYSDSAHYDISVQIVDSFAVRMTGGKTGEVVTLRGTPVVSGFDRTYSSSNPANATGTRLETPTSCPEAASWYDSFRSANYRSTNLASRRLAPTAPSHSHSGSVPVLIPKPLERIAPN
jgi:hypothetical protein